MGHACSVVLFTTPWIVPRQAPVSIEYFLSVYHFCQAKVFFKWTQIIKYRKSYLGKSVLYTMKVKFAIT